MWRGIWEPFQPERGQGGPTRVRWETRQHYRRTGSKCELEELEGQQDFWSQGLWGPRRRWTRRPEPSLCTRVGRGLGGVWHGWHLGGLGGLAYSSETRSNLELRQRRRRPVHKARTHGGEESKSLTLELTARMGHWMQGEKPSKATWEGLSGGQGNRRGWSAKQGSRKVGMGR